MLSTLVLEELGGRLFHAISANLGSFRLLRLTLTHVRTLGCGPSRSSGFFPTFGVGWLGCTSAILFPSAPGPVEAAAFPRVSSPHKQGQSFHKDVYAGTPYLQLLNCSTGCSMHRLSRSSAHSVPSMQTATNVTEAGLRRVEGLHQGAQPHALKEAAACLLW